MRIARARPADGPRDEWRLRELDRRQPGSMADPSPERAMGHAGRTAGFQPNGLVVMGGAQLLTGGMTYDANALIVPRSTIYRLHACFYVTGGSGYVAEADLLLNGQTVDTMPRGFRDKPGTSDDRIFFGSLHVLAEGDAVSMTTRPSGGSTWGTNGFNGSFIELIEQ